MRDTRQENNIFSVPVDYKESLWQWRSVGNSSHILNAKRRLKQIGFTTGFQRVESREPGRLLREGSIQKTCSNWYHMHSCAMHSQSKTRLAIHNKHYKVPRGGQGKLSLFLTRLPEQWFSIDFRQRRGLELYLQYKQIHDNQPVSFGLPLKSLLKQGVEMFRSIRYNTIGYISELWCAAWNSNILKLIIDRVKFS